MKTFDEYKYLQIANKSWDDKYINFILSHQDKFWSFSMLSANPNITLDMFFAHPELHWNFESLSRNPNLTMDFIKSHPELPWNWMCLSINPNISF